MKKNKVGESWRRHWIRDWDSGNGNKWLGRWCRILNIIK